MNESENATNSTASHPIQNSSVVFMITSSVIYVIIIIASLLWNTTICVVILSTRSLRRSVNSRFILSLSVSDLMTTCLVMSFELELIISHEWKHGEIMCNVWTTTYLLAVPTSILSLLALTVYRYRLLQDPLDIYKASPLMTRRRATLVICVLWVYSMLFALVPVFGWKTNPRSVIGGICYFNISWIYSALSSLVNFVTPVVTASLLYFRMYCFAIKLSHSSLPQDVRSGKNKPIAGFDTKMQNASSDEPEDMEKPTRPKPMEISCDPLPKEQQHIVSNRSQHEDLLLRKLQKRNTRAAKTTFLIVFSFVFCWLPYTLLSITRTICHLHEICYISVPNQVDNIFLMMGYLNSAVNPVLYSFRSPEFKKAVKDIIRKRVLFPSARRRSKHCNAMQMCPKYLHDIPSTENLFVNLTHYNATAVHETSF